jgi:transcriptional regulator with XRE-family HTH domain
MFKQNFINICIDRGVAPTAVLREIGIAHATFTNWTNDSVPRQTTLVKIADYFGITPDDLLRDPAEKASTPTAEPAEPNRPLSSFETEILDLIDQLTVKELREFKAQLEETIKNRKQ